jgi:hypothetical protein
MVWRVPPLEARRERYAESYPPQTAATNDTESGRSGGPVNTASATTVAGASG